MALSRPSPNNVPPDAPEGMRSVWHPAGGDWVFDAALPVPPKTLRDRADAVCDNRIAQGVAFVGAVLLWPVVWVLGAIGVFWAGWGLFWLLAQFGMGPMS
jgi:hypothetical protein